MAEQTAHRLNRSTRTAIGILLVIPIVAMLAVFTYARDAPPLWGIPFFYWYQLLWVVLGSACAAAAIAVIERARRRDST